MQYFKNSQLKKQYSISYTAINNWIRAAKAGKLDLQLYDEADKSFIIDTTKNRLVIEDLVARGKKFKNTRSLKIVSPKPDFYKLYSRKQIFDIITNIDIHREIPRQYNYFDKGAEYWDAYAERMATEESPNNLNSTVELLSLNLKNIERQIEGKRWVNVIDIGPGNGLPVKELLGHLLDRGVLARYIAIDISKKMLEIAERNIKTWFDGAVQFEGYVRDINFERFDDLLAEETIMHDAVSRANLVLLLGSTLANFRTPADALKVIYSSIGRNDLLLYSVKLDSEASRHFFDFNTPGVNALPLNHRLIFDLLNIDDSFFWVETGYSEQTRERFIKARFKTAISIRFDFEHGERQIDLNKNDSILLWRAWHDNALSIIDQFTNVGFALLLASVARNREYMLLGSAIETNRL